MGDSKVAFVTGASRGIGKAIAVQLAKDGYSLAALGTKEEKNIEKNLKEIKKISKEFLYIKADIAKREDRLQAVECVFDRFGRIDVLVNNAGVAPAERMDLLNTTEESFDHVLDVNLRGTFFLTQAVARIMAEQSKMDEAAKPKIINISSVSAYSSSVNRGEYCISKAGVGMITKLFADRLAEFGINVYEIRPGIIMTDMTAAVLKKYDEKIKDGLTPIKRWGFPQDVADAVSVICEGKFNFSTGEVFNIDGGFHLRRL